MFVPVCMCVIAVCFIHGVAMFLQIISRLRDDELEHMNAGLDHGAEQV